MNPTPEHPTRRQIISKFNAANRNNAAYYRYFTNRNLIATGSQKSPKMAKLKQRYESGDLYQTALRSQTHPLIRYGLFKEEELAFRGRVGRQLSKDKTLLKSSKRYRCCCEKFLNFGCKDYKKPDNDFDDPGYDFKHPISLPMRCEHRLCPRCARIRGKVVEARVREMLKRAHITRNDRVALLTLTSKNNGKISRRKLRIFSRHFRKLINHYFPKGKGFGAIAAIEVGAKFNIHVHCMIFGPYIPQVELSAKWLEITGNSTIVDIRSVYNPAKAVRYITKYISKVPTFTRDTQYRHYAKAIQGIRRLHTFGIFYNFTMPKQPFCCPICKTRFIPTSLRYPSETLEFYFNRYENYCNLKKALEN